MLVKFIRYSLLLNYPILSNNDRNYLIISQLEFLQEWCQENLKTHIIIDYRDQGSSPSLIKRKDDITNEMKAEKRFSIKMKTFETTHTHYSTLKFIISLLKQNCQV